MATSKTLAPTNVTINIPAMADQPDMSVVSNCIDKEADAINTLNSQISRVKKFGVAQVQASLVNSVTIAAGSAGKIFDNVNIKTGNVLTSFAVGTVNDIPDTITGVVLLWASGGSSCFASDQISWSDGKVTLGVTNVGGSSAILTAVRLLLFGYYN